MIPSQAPEPISRRNTFHQSRSFTSPTAIARMISVVACEPELPPLEMISGRNIASTAAFSISPLYPCIAVAVSISPRKRTISQVARFFTMRGSEIVV